jgi:hypothetical protein
MDNPDVRENPWVDIRCTWLEEARSFRSVLEAEGIEALIPDEHTLALPLFADSEPGAVRLLVRSADLERALDVLGRIVLPE